MTGTRKGPKRMRRRPAPDATHARQELAAALHQLHHAGRALEGLGHTSEARELRAVLGRVKRHARKAVRASLPYFYTASVQVLGTRGGIARHQAAQLATISVGNLARDGFEVRP